MKIVILNGSPKGDLSVTMQYIHFIEKKHPEHEYIILNVAAKIKGLEKNEQKFQEIIEQVDTADLIIWGFPLYYLLVSSQYKRFIELIFERNATGAFQGKFTALIATSIKFYDHTALNYIHGICDDLNMRVIDEFSAEMYDLFRRRGRKNILQFAENVFSHISDDLPSPRLYPSINYIAHDYNPADNGSNSESISLKDKKCFIVSDGVDPDKNLGKMVNKFASYFDGNVEIIDLQELDIKSGCMACLNCGYDNVCLFEGKDDFTDFWKRLINEPDILIYAGEIKDRYLSWRWKQVFDRSFFKGHTPSLKGKQIGIIISGPLRQLHNLREILTTYFETQETNLAGIITDEYEDSEEIDSQLHGLARVLVRGAEIDYMRPRTFRKVAGIKVFRDRIYRDLRAVFQADHRYYKEYGVYDFPKKTTPSRFLKMLLSIKGIRNKMYSTQRLKQEMVKPFKRLLSRYDHSHS